MERSGPSQACSILNGKRVPVCLAIGVLVAIVLGFWAFRETRSPDLNKTRMDISSLPSSSSPYKNTSPGVLFVGDEACARCHAEIAQAYRQHPMGRSAATPDKVLPEVNGLVFGVKDMTYSIDRRGGRLFHTETRGDGSDGVHGKTEAEVRYVIGSGSAAMLSWSSGRANSFNLRSPGIARGGSGTCRPITASATGTSTVRSPRAACSATPIVSTRRREQTPRLPRTDDRLRTMSRARRAPCP